jgi:hypothetical protein
LERATYGFMDKVDFEEELGLASDGNSIYPTVELLEEHHPCCNQCGIVKVSVQILNVDPDFSEDDSSARCGFMDFVQSLQTSGFTFGLEKYTVFDSKDRSQPDS